MWKSCNFSPTSQISSSEWIQLLHHHCEWNERKKRQKPLRARQSSRLAFAITDFKKLSAETIKFIALFAPSSPFKDESSSRADCAIRATYAGSWAQSVCARKVLLVFFYINFRYLYTLGATPGALRINRTLMRNPCVCIFKGCKHTLSADLFSSLWNHSCGNN